MTPPDEPEEDEDDDFYWSFSPVSPGAIMCGIMGIDLVRPPNVIITNITNEVPHDHA